MIFLFKIFTLPIVLSRLGIRRPWRPHPPNNYAPVYNCLVSGYFLSSSIPKRRHFGNWIYFLPREQEGCSSIDLGLI